MYLRCSEPECKVRLDLHDRSLSCPECGELLEVAVDDEKFKPVELKRTWLERRMSHDPRDSSGVWRFRDFLPSYKADQVVTMGEGNEPLIAGQITSKWSGAKNIFFKHLGWNPTACFKDLGMTTGITEAKYHGASVVACASTGNTSGSMAAYAARAGIKARVYLPGGAVSKNKLAQALDYGAEVVQIEGNFDEALDILLAKTDEDIYFLNSINPFRIEGQKTVMFEMLEQLNWKAPDYVFVPGGNLGNSSAFGKALMELKAFGFIDKVPRIIIVQAEGANPLARTWRSKSKELQKVTNPETAATAIRIGVPKSWRKALRVLEFTDGMVIDVTEDEIAAAKAVIGRDGIGCEPASATTLAGLKNLVAKGIVPADATVVAILTGHVLKDTDYILKHQQSEKQLEAVEAR